MVISYRHMSFRRQMPHRVTKLTETGYLSMHLRPIQYKSISGSSSAELATSVSSSTSSSPSSASERSSLLPDNDEDGEEELSSEAGSNFVTFNKPTVFRRF
jgi:hypothetical protein